MPPREPEYRIVTRSGVRCLSTAVAHGTFGPQLQRDGVEWIILHDDGATRDVSGDAVHPEAAGPEIAWGTSDLFREGAPLRRFFSLMLESRTLRWFQSPAAGYDDEVFRLLVDRGVRITNAHVNSLPIAEFVMRVLSSMSSRRPRPGETRLGHEVGVSTTGAKCRERPGSSSGSAGSAPRWRCGRGRSEPT